MTVNNYEALGITRFTKLTEGWTPCAITKIEIPTEKNFPFVRNYDVAINVHFKPFGRGDFEFSQLFIGNYKRNDQGKIINAGSAFPILDIFTALGILAVNSDGSVKEEVLKDCVSKTPNIKFYMYKEASKDGDPDKFYWRAWKRVLPISADESREAALIKVFRKDLSLGYPRRYISDAPQSKGPKVTVSETNEL